MIKFSTLKVSDDCRQLTVKVSVEPYSFYKNVYIDSIIIDTQDTFTVSGPSSNNVYMKEVEGNSKEVTLIISKTDFNTLIDFNKGLFFVYVTIKGTVEPDTPCGYDRYYDLGVTMNTRSLYESLMYYIRQIDKTCSVPKDLINKYLQIKAFTTSLKTGNYILAIKYWNKFLRYGIITNESKGNKCECSLWIE